MALMTHPHQFARTVHTRCRYILSSTAGSTKRTLRLPRMKCARAVDDLAKPRQFSMLQKL
eukprot:1005120-Pleurochrysis_carterae.AAC.2